MKLVKLRIFPNGPTCWLNPDWVVGVYESNMGVKAAEIWTGEGVNEHIIVMGTPGEVVDLITSLAPDATQRRAT